MIKIVKNVCIVIVFIISFSGLTGCLSVSPMAGGEQYSNPDWAPMYYPGVRYYYLPDIETYYDLSNQDFVYLDNGQWLFSNTLPSMYSSYDLYDGYEIALNIDVYQPWMHHQFYVSNYPRYYYRNMYNNSSTKIVRGFNENVRKPFFATPDDRIRRTELSKKNQSVITPKMTRQSQQSNYYGRNIGRPVKVRPQMRQIKSTTRSQENSGTKPQREIQGGSGEHGRH